MKMALESWFLIVRRLRIGDSSQQSGM